ncbi:putative Receptor-like protein kinase-related family protein [Tripterygium wilfordii]|uniref:Putative Receptor-like protein kinase-related family protein n=2 Tax=Tripterygium wilfordii TaxID=458696 RepID=A0A7J7D7A9_TRIWF|nr:putative Receptor-like protein kinase-related family protein [Tripterygium wilfordii]
MELLVITLMLLSTTALSLADTNVLSGSECSEADNAATQNPFQTNLNNLLNSLTTSVPLHGGFYKTTTGKDSGKIYGLVQCRGDVSTTDCLNCSKKSTSAALQGCPRSKKIKVWFTWCFLRYSDDNFFGIWDQSSTALTNDTNLEDPSVVSQGLNFMTELASTTAKQPSMFETAVLDGGESGKRYGMGQCTRDISRSDCSSCLEAQLETFRTTIGNKRSWEIYGSSCSMWYHDFQFYFNISTPANDGDRSISLHGVAIGMGIAELVLLLWWIL